MFGFVRPVKSELRFREAERFQSVYCGLCHAIKQRYGNFHTMFLSYDMTFLALLLESLPDEMGEACAKRCLASPVKKKCVQGSDAAMERTADLSVLLMYHKLSDAVADDKGFKWFAAKALRRMSRAGYQKARRLLPQADKEMAQCLEELGQIEKARLPSLDRAADPFARLLAACVPEDLGTAQRILRELLYHLGRWIYLIDACMDVEEDFASGNYNPVLLRYELRSPELAPVQKQLERTLERSLVSVHAAFALLEIKRDKELLENIICLGLPVVTRQVLDKTYQPNGGRIRHGSI